VHPDNVTDRSDEELLGTAAALSTRCLQWDGHDQELFTRVSVELDQRRRGTETLIPALN